MARVFWDTNLFIYSFEENAEWSPRVIELRRRMPARGDELPTSYLTVGEVITKPKKAEEPVLRKQAFRKSKSGVAIHLVSASRCRRGVPVGEYQRPCLCSRGLCSRGLCSRGLCSPDSAPDTDGSYFVPGEPSFPGAQLGYSVNEHVILTL